MAKITLEQIDTICKESYDFANSYHQEINKQEDSMVISKTEYNKVKQELEKYKNAIGYFEQIGYKDIVKNLLSY